MVVAVNVRIAVSGLAGRDEVATSSEGEEDDEVREEAEPAVVLWEEVAAPCCFAWDCSLISLPSQLRHLNLTGAASHLPSATNWATRAHTRKTIAVMRKRLNKIQGGLGSCILRKAQPRSVCCLPEESEGDGEKRV